MRLLRMGAVLLILVSTPMFTVGILRGSAILWAGSFVVWGMGLLGCAALGVAGKR